MYIRHGTYSIDEVLSKRVNPCNKDKDSEIIFDGKRVLMNSQRYQLFAEKGLKCAICGIEGKYFALEINLTNYGKKLSQEQINNLIENGRYHFNLYAVKEDGTEVMMTKDHIIPKSKGGPSCLWNYQTMCWHCNSIIKGSKIIES